MELDDRKAAILRGDRRGVRRHRAAGRVADDHALPRPRGVERHGPQRDDRARARGLPRAAPHVGGPDPHRPRATATSSTTSTGSRALAPAQRRAVADFFTLFQSAHQVLEDLLHETSQLLARRHHARRGGRRPARRGRHRAQRAARDRCSPSLVLALAILSNGAVEKCDPARRPTISTTPPSPPPARCSTRSSRVAGGAACPTLRRRRRRRRPTRSPRDARDALAGRRRAGVVEPLYVGGASRLAAEQEAFPTTDSAARLLELLEHQVEVVVARARAARPGRSPCASAPRTRSTSCATARSCSRRTTSRARSPAPSACSGRPAWTTARRSPRSPPSRSNSADVLS